MVYIYISDFYSRLFPCNPNDLIFMPFYIVCHRERECTWAGNGVFHKHRSSMHSIKWQLPEIVVGVEQQCTQRVIIHTLINKEAFFAQFTYLHLSNEKKNQTEVYVVSMFT